MLGSVDTNCENNCPGCPVQRRLADKARRAAVGHALNAAGVAHVLDSDYRAVPETDTPESYASARMSDMTDAHEALLAIVDRSAEIAKNCQRPTHVEIGKLSVNYCTSTVVPAYLSFGLD